MLLYNNKFSFFIESYLISQNQLKLVTEDPYINQLLLIIYKIFVCFDDEWKVRNISNLGDIIVLYLHDEINIFFDISKMFDKVWNQKAIFKLKHNRI